MSLIIKTKSPKDERFLKDLLLKLGFTTSVVKEEELEDYYFGKQFYKDKKENLLTLNEAKAYYSKLKKK